MPSPTRPATASPQAKAPPPAAPLESMLQAQHMQLQAMAQAQQMQLQELAQQQQTMLLHIDVMQAQIIELQRTR